MKQAFHHCTGSRDLEVEHQALVGPGTDVHAVQESIPASDDPKMKGMWEVMRISIVFCPIWFIANWSYNESLVLTTVSCATILASTTPV